MATQINRIVDAHVHWWDVEANAWYEFIRHVGEMTGTDLYRNYLPADYRRSVGEAPVSKVIHVSAVVGTQRYVDELRWLDGLAPSSGFEVGCVGSVDPALDSAELRAPAAQGRPGALGLAFRNRRGILSGMGTVPDRLRPRHGRRREGLRAGHG